MTCKHCGHGDDIWAIEYGYAPPPAGPTWEQFEQLAELVRHLAIAMRGYHASAEAFAVRQALDRMLEKIPRSSSASATDATPASSHDISTGAGELKDGER